MSNTNRQRHPSKAQIKDVRAIGHEFAQTCETVIRTALRKVRKKSTFQEAPDVACSVLVGRASNDLNDYFHEYYRHDFDPPAEMDDPSELSGMIAIKAANVVRKHSKLVLQDMYEDGINDEEFEELMFAELKTEILALVADEYGIEEQTENVQF